MTCSSHTSSSTSNSTTRTSSILNFLPPPSARQYIHRPTRRMSLHPIPSNSYSSSSSSSSDSCFSTISSSSAGTPPSDHGSSMQDDKDIHKAMREYHAAVASWTAKTWQAVRFVIEQRSRHPAYNNPSPRARSKSPHLPVQNHTSLHSLTTDSASNSFSSCNDTPLSANKIAHGDSPATRAPPTRLNSFRKQSTSPPSIKDDNVSGLSALFASHATITASSEN